MNKQIDFLVIGRPSRFRDSIYLLLTSISQHEKILLADDVEPVLKMKEVPGVVVVDADVGNDRLSVTLKKTKSVWPQAKLFVLVEDELQFQAARVVGVDVLLCKGFRATKFVKAVEASLSK